MGNLVISTNRTIPYPEFQRLMDSATYCLNCMVQRDEKSYIKAGAEAVEGMVYEAMKTGSVGTPFEGTIQLVSGHKFPDIIAGRYYGTEVKSTKSNKWESFGNSIFENTRVKDVERIFLTFGKMASPVAFRSKPYEDCISGIVVDHSPRYHIDMEIQEKGKQTIFEELQIPYDDFRQKSCDVQVDIIARKSKEGLAEDETLWWSPDREEQMVEPTLRLLSAYSPEDRERITAQACCFFPELFGSSGRTKYNRYLMWLVTDKNIVTGSARDGFSAGGRVEIQLNSGVIVKAPAIMGRVRKYRMLIEQTINNTPERTLKDRWRVGGLKRDRIRQWIDLCIPYASQLQALDESLADQVFEAIFYPNSLKK